jgi:hypothetical protein
LAHRPDDEGRCANRAALSDQPDLLVAGILFHDSGKLWENYLPETGFSMPFDEQGEMIGHIALGMDLVNSLGENQTDERVTEWHRSADGGLSSPFAALDRFRIMASAVRVANLFRKRPKRLRSITSIISTPASK